MNIPFRIRMDMCCAVLSCTDQRVWAGGGDVALEALFVEEAAQHGLLQLEGHRCAVCMSVLCRHVLC
jgi:phosphoserine aminotransferase